MRKIKEKYQMTELRKQANRVAFGPNAQDEIGSSGKGLGLINQSMGTGKLRVSAQDRGTVLSFFSVLFFFFISLLLCLFLSMFSLSSCSFSSLPSVILSPLPHLSSLPLFLPPLLSTQAFSRRKPTWVAPQGQLRVSVPPLLLPLCRGSNLRTLRPQHRRCVRRT